MPTINFSNATGTFTYEEAAPVPPDPEPPPNGNGWTPPSYLRTDTRVEKIPNTPKPGYLASTTDPVFKTKITRITGDPGTAIQNIQGARWPDVARHHYSSDQAWNADQSMIYLDQPGLILDGSSYEPMFLTKGYPGDCDVRWSVTDPAVLNFAAGSKLGTWNPKTGVQAVIKDFGSAYSDMKFGPWEGSFSENGNMVVLSCSKGGRTIGFAYNVKTDEKHADVAMAYDNVRISSKGTYIIWGCSPDKVIITDLNGTTITTLPNNYISHFDVITDGAGDEVVVGRVNSSSVGQGPDGRISKYRLKDGKRTGLSQGGWCSHTGSRNLKGHRWSVSDALLEGANYPPYNGELIMCALDGSVVYRLCHTHTNANVDYVGQTQPSHSPDGGRVIFASVWGNSSRPVGCYVVDFRK